MVRQLLNDRMSELPRALTPHRELQAVSVLVVLFIHMTATFSSNCDSRCGARSPAQCRLECEEAAEACYTLKKVRTYSFQRQTNPFKLGHGQRINAKATYSVNEYVSCWKCLKTEGLISLQVLNLASISFSSYSVLASYR